MKKLILFALLVTALLSACSYVKAVTPTPLPPTPTVAEMAAVVKRVKTVHGKNGFDLVGCEAQYFLTSKGDQYFKLNDMGGMLILLDQGAILHSETEGDVFMTYPIWGTIEGNRFWITSKKDLCPPDIHDVIPHR